MALFAACYFRVRNPAGASGASILELLSSGGPVFLCQDRFLAAAHRVAVEQATVTGKSLLICDGKG
jgi:hypothetical protein